MPALIEVQNVRKVFGGGFIRKRPGTVALDGLSMQVEPEPSTIIAVVGESGSGKSTLARLLLGLAAPTSGSVLYRGTDIRNLHGDDRIRFLRDVQAIFQDPYEVYNPFYK